MKQKFFKSNKFYIYNYYFQPNRDINNSKSSILRFIKYCEINSIGIFNYYPNPNGGNYNYQLNSIDIVDSKYLNNLEILYKVKNL